MEKENERLISEIKLIEEERNDIKNSLFDKDYSMYNSYILKMYDKILIGVNEVFEKNETSAELIKYISSIHFTPHHRHELFTLRNNPFFKKIMGEMALKQKDKLENILGINIPLYEKELPIDNNPISIMKIIMELQKELYCYSNELKEMFRISSISEEQYYWYDKMLAYIYSYYVSFFRGEQKPFKKITNKEYIKIEEEARLNRISFYDQLRLEKIDFKKEFEELQNIEQVEYKK